MRATSSLGRFEFRGWLKIGTIHHNIERGGRKDNENLGDVEDLERVLSSHLHLVLHGHTHRARWGRLRELPWFATGSAGLKQQIRPYGVPKPVSVPRL
jgi:predicted phosphodiesterase